MGNQENKYPNYKMEYRSKHNYEMMKHICLRNTYRNIQILNYQQNTNQNYSEISSCANHNAQGQ